MAPSWTGSLGPPRAFPEGYWAGAGPARCLLAAVQGEGWPGERTWGQYSLLYTLQLYRKTLAAESKCVVTWGSGVQPLPAADPLAEKTLSGDWVQPLPRLPGALFWERGPGQAGPGEGRVDKARLDPHKAHRAPRDHLAGGSHLG